MHIFFSGIGGAGIGPLSLIAKKAGYKVSGSDKQASEYTAYLKINGIDTVTIGQSADNLKSLHKKDPIDWFVYSSAVVKENPNHPELVTAEKLGIKTSKRDEFLAYFIKQKNLKMIAIAGTHGKTTTAAMAIWLCKQLNIPISYSVGAKLSFGAMGEYSPESEYFIYEADEYDRNFLSFKPYISIISGVAYDHPDIYPTLKDYNAAFRKFIDQCEHTFIWDRDAEKLAISSSEKIIVLPKKDNENVAEKLVGEVNRENAAIVAQAIQSLESSKDIREFSSILNDFPGVSRRFEKITENIYSDYAHTPEKIRGALQVAQEIAGKNVIVVYEGLHNTRQHFIKNELENLFHGIKKLFIVPSYLAREDLSLEMLTPEKLQKIIKTPTDREAAQLNTNLLVNIKQHALNGDLVLCLSAGGGGSLDEWLRKNVKS